QRLADEPSDCALPGERQSLFRGGDTDARDDLIVRFVNRPSDRQDTSRRMVSNDGPSALPRG
ncbi:hypothetical protein RCK87_25275, partial [Salmonella enterica subsp. enterica serovar 1,4,[5],12:i:-]